MTSTRPDSSETDLSAGRRGKSMLVNAYPTVLGAEGSTSASKLISLQSEPTESSTGKEDSGHAMTVIAYDEHMLVAYFLSHGRP